MRRLGSIGAVLVLGTVLLPSTVSSATTTERVNETVPQSEDAPWYAAEYAVSIQTANENLHLQELAGDLGTSLRDSGDERFGGMWIEHGSFLTVYISRTDESFTATNVPAELEGHLLYVGAEFAERELESHEEVVAQQLNADGVIFASSIDVVNNNIDVTVGDLENVELANQLVEAASRGPSAPDVVVTVGDLPQPQVAFYGGTFLTSCTAGFSVRSTVNSNVGLSTAAHCANAQARSGVNMPYVIGLFSGSNDVQWNRVPSPHTVRPWVYDGINDSSTPYYRIITGQTIRTAQNVGTTVCKRGQSTGYGCGEITSRTYRPPTTYVTSPAATWVTVARNGRSITQPGDSGAPWFSGSRAWGVHSGAATSFSLYQAVDYMANINVRIIY